jgi:virginiamycin B lyase
MMKTLFLVVVAALLLIPEKAHAQAPASASPVLTEWDVPWAETRPRDPIAGADGRVWFVGQRADYVAILDPETGDFERIELPEGAGPHNVILDDDGHAWYAGNRAQHIGRIDRDSHEITRFDMPDERLRDPHTMIFGPTGHLWFTAQGGNHIGRLDPNTGNVDVIAVPTERSRPYGLVMGADGTPWAVLFGTNKLASINPETLELTEHVLPHEEIRPRRLGITSDGRVWYVDYATGRLGAFHPGTGEVAEWQTPGGESSQPYAMAIDDRDRIWFVESGVSPNMFVGFDPVAESFIDGVPVESDGGTVRHMIFDAASRLVWFGTDTNTIGRAQLD